MATPSALTLTPSGCYLGVPGPRFETKAEVRMYAQVTALGLVAVYAYARRWPWLYALAGIATLYTHALVTRAVSSQYIGNDIDFFLWKTTSQPTAVVNEAYIRMLPQRAVSWENRAHFFGIAAKMMRRVLVDHARRRHAAKRDAPSGSAKLTSGIAGLARAVLGGSTRRREPGARARWGGSSLGKGAA